MRPPEESARLIENARLISIVRLEHRELGREVVSQLIEGGVRVIEFSLAMPGALELLRECSGSFADRALLRRRDRAQSRPGERSGGRRGLVPRLAQRRRRGRAGGDVA